MPFETDKEFWDAMCVVRKDVLGMANEHPMDGFGGIPGPWLVGPDIKFRCRNDHVGSMPRVQFRYYVEPFDFQSVCPREDCGASAFITSPIDHDGLFRLYEAILALQIQNQELERQREDEEAYAEYCDYEHGFTEDPDDEDNNE